MSNAPRVTQEDINVRIADTEIVKHVSKSGQVLRWAVITMVNGFAVTGEPSCAVSKENDNVEDGERIAIDNAKNEIWKLEGYLLKQLLWNIENDKQAFLVAEENIIRGVPLRYNVGTQDKYINRINKTLINPLMKETEKEVNNLFDEFAAGLITFPVLNSKSRRILNDIEKKYGVIFKRQAEKIAKSYINDVQKQSKSGVKRNLKVLSLGRTTAFKENKGNIGAIYNTSNIGLQSLILGMGSFYLAKVRKQVEQAVLARSEEGVRKYLIKQKGVTHRKTKNDLEKNYRQTFNAFNREYLVNNKITQWVWVHTNRAKEQNPYHVNSLNGLVFNYASPPPVIDQKTGTTGYPGDWYGCMCIMLPVQVY